MTEPPVSKQPTVLGMRVKFALASIMTMLAMVATASAGLNDSIGPILDSLVQLFTPLLAMIVAAVPIIITMAIIGFIVGLLAAILRKLNF